jgi:hypothetical protein
MSAYGEHDSAFRESGAEREQIVRSRRRFLPYKKMLSSPRLRERFQHRAASTPARPAARSLRDEDQTPDRSDVPTGRLSRETQEELSRGVLFFAPRELVSTSLEEMKR